MTRACRMEVSVVYPGVGQSGGGVGHLLLARAQWEDDRNTLSLGLLNGWGWQGAERPGRKNHLTPGILQPDKHYNRVTCPFLKATSITLNLGWMPAPQAEFRNRDLFMRP